MQQEKPARKTSLFQLLFIIPPVIVLVDLHKLAGNYISINPIILSACLGVIGVLIGTGLERLVHGKSTLVKIITWIAMMIFLFGLVYLLSMK